jgi:hypothetical protein
MQTWHMATVIEIHSQPYHRGQGLRVEHEEYASAVLLRRVCCAVCHGKG